MNFFRTALAALVATSCLGAAYAEGDVGSHRPPRATLATFNLPASIPPEARRAVLPGEWRNLGTVTCAANDTNAAGITSCSRFATHQFTTSNRDSARIILQLRAPVSHCAPIIYVAYLDVADGNTTPYYFGALHPGASSSRSISVQPGAHTLSIGAYGDTGMGGCNTSGITSWSVDVRLEADGTPG